MPTLAGVDCSNPIGGAAAAAAGKAFVGRYLSTIPGPKVLTAGEALDLLGHGIGILVIGEDTEADLTSGPAHAANLAAAYAAHARALGVPPGVAIVMTCDNNGGAPADVEASMAAAATVIRQDGYLAGFYGPKDPARALKAAATVDVTFVVDTWGQDQPGDQWNFRQLPNAGYQTVGGVECDVDDAPNPAGLWTRASEEALSMDIDPDKWRGGEVRKVYLAVFGREPTPFEYGCGKIWLAQNGNDPDGFACLIADSPAGQAARAARNPQG